MMNSMVRENEIAADWPSVSTNFRVHEDAFKPYLHKANSTSSQTKSHVSEYYQVYRSDTSDHSFTKINRRDVRDAAQAAKMRMMIMVVIAVTALFIAGGFMFGQESSGLEAQQYDTVRIVSGDTLWDIAKEYAPEDQSIRSFISEIQKANDLMDSNIQEGMVLRIPV